MVRGIFACACLVVLVGGVVCLRFELAMLALLGVFVLDCGERLDELIRAQGDTHRELVAMRGVFRQAATQRPMPTADPVAAPPPVVDGRRARWAKVLR